MLCEEKWVFVYDMYFIFFKFFCCKIMFLQFEIMYLIQVRCTELKTYVNAQNTGEC